MASPELRQRVKDALSELDVLIGLLPASVPTGSPDDPLATYFGDLSIDAEEGPYYSLDRAWLRVFQVPEADQLSRITRGEFGTVVAHKFFKFFADAPGIEAHNGLFLLAERLSSLNCLVALR